MFGWSWSQSRGWAIDSWCFTFLKDSQDGALPPPEVSTRCLEMWALALNLAPLSGQCRH